MNNLPAFRVTYTDGTSYVTSMAAGTTLADAQAYFVGTTHTMSDEKTTKRVARVDAFEAPAPCVRILDVPGATPAGGRVSSTEFIAFFDSLAALYRAYWPKQYPTCEANWNTLVYKFGPKWVKISSVPPKYAGASAYCFINLETGDIHKAASWKAPAKHARGNIRKGNATNWWNDALTPYGGSCLR